MHVTPIRLLLVEDSDDDAQLVLRELRRSGYEPTTTRVDRAEPFADALREGTWDIILADFNLPTFSGLEALEIYQASGLDIPFLLVSGTVGEETAVSAMIAGAHDYVLKDNLTRLGPAVTRELREYHIRRGRREDHRRVVASERRFTTIFGSSPVATIITDVDDGLILDLNPAALTLTGWRREHVIGRSTTHLGLWRDQAEHRRVVSAALDAGPGHSVERTITPPGRNPLTVLASFALIELDGHGRLLLMMQDITARKAAEETLRESEERYRLLIENSHDLVAELDVEGRFLYASPQYTGTTGYSSAQLLGTRALDYVHPQDRAAMQAHLEQMEESATVRYRFRHHNGSWLSFESGGRAFVRSGGERRAVLITRDLSEQLRADEARKALEAQLREAQKMEAIGTLAGGIAHDFNNILTGIFGYVQLAEMETAADHPARSYLAGIMRSSERARDLVAQILTFSRRREQQRSVGRLAPIVHDALRLLRASLPATIEFRVDLDAQCPPVLCDSTQLHQVVMNLGTNAAYAMRERNGVLTVKLATCRADPSVVVSHPQLCRGPVVCL
ncbi:MAG TPA: PAS domain S-box protein, partial [Candidatus Synoicihabitans sp.]|nr:PAS domain S-box protein [Candidatus Synoicihabitans sp.]